MKSLDYGAVEEMEDAMRVWKGTTQPESRAAKLYGFSTKVV